MSQVLNIRYLWNLNKTFLSCYFLNIIIKFWIIPRNMKQINMSTIFFCNNFFCAGVDFIKVLLDIHISRHLERVQFKLQATKSRLTYFIPLWLNLSHKISQPEMTTITSLLLTACNRKDLPKSYPNRFYALCHSSLRTFTPQKSFSEVGCRAQKLGLGCKPVYEMDPSWDPNSRLVRYWVHGPQFGI